MSITIETKLAIRINLCIEAILSFRGCRGGGGAKGGVHDIQDYSSLSTSLVLKCMS